MNFATGHSIFWRLSDETGKGSDVVSIVLANRRKEAITEIEIETDIISVPIEVDSAQSPVDIAWDHQDLDLFLTLLRNSFPIDEKFEERQQIELDINDDNVLRIMHIVAAARFSTPYPAETVVNTKRSSIAKKASCQVGELISLDTIDGFKPGVVVSVNDKDLRCILLDEITSPVGDNIQLERHDMLILKKEWALSAAFSTTEPSKSDLIH